jgi:hypothetical protein
MIPNYLTINKFTVIWFEGGIIMDMDKAIDNLSIGDEVVIQEGIHTFTGYIQSIGMGTLTIDGVLFNRGTGNAYGVENWEKGVCLATDNGELFSVEEHLSEIDW